MPPGEQERVEKRLRSLITNVRNAFRLIVLGIGDSGKPVVIGEGLEALKDAGAISRAREDITAGFGISLAMILSNEANYATALEDRKTLYTNTVNPMAEFVAEVWNEQLFKPMGYKWIFKPEEMEIFQEDEVNRATSLAQLVTALADPELFLISADILGYDLDDETLLAIQALIEKKDTRREAMAQVAAQNPNPPQPGEQPPQLAQAQQEPQPNPQADEFAKWRRKSLRAVKAGKSGSVEFESDIIPADVMTDVHAQLIGAVTEDAVKLVFDNVHPVNIEPVDNSIMALAAELKRANDLLEKTTDA